MVFVQLWLMVTFGIMLLAIILYAIETSPASFRNDGADRQFAQMFFFAPVWPVVAAYALFLFSRYFYALIVAMWRSVRGSSESPSETP